MNRRHSSLTLCFIAFIHLACNDVTLNNADHCNPERAPYHRYALLSSRINDLEELSSILKIDYYQAKSNSTKKGVRLSYCSELGLIYSELLDGLSQDQVMEARKAGVFKKLEVLLAEPGLVQNRKHLKDIYLLSRRRHDVYGYGDVAFYDLALQASQKIKINEDAFSFARDSSEKGYINTFNHITAQAVITSIYSAELADLIADIHERYNMPELISGEFSREQLESLDNNPVDNYVDIINNEVGQLLGKVLKRKYGIELHQEWNEKLLCKYLNDLQSFYSKAFKVHIKPFKEDEYVIKHFCQKLNSYYRIDYESRS